MEARRCAPTSHRRQAPAGALAIPPPPFGRSAPSLRGRDHSPTTTVFPLHFTISIPSQYHPFLRSQCGKAHVIVIWLDAAGGTPGGGAEVEPAGCAQAVPVTDRATMRRSESRFMGITSGRA